MPGKTVKMKVKRRGKRGRNDTGEKQRGANKGVLLIIVSNVVYPLEANPK